MTATTTTTTTHRPGASTCGGGCGGGSAGRGQGTGTAGGSGAFTRPRFFAGQLLTEDDLELLTGYVTGKNRLRNRMLFGPGVVSGLQVVCDPCGGGDVVVRPGYALDCCGNDIVVPCAETVSLTELVHDLRVRGSGVDCGDPCDDGSDPGGPRSYGLYVRYAETEAEPVAPYVTGEPCPSTGCVPSRVREGFAFLVKCPEDRPDHGYRPGKAFRRAVGERREFLAVWSRGRRLNRYRERVRAAALAENTVIAFEPADGARFTSARNDLDSILQHTDTVNPSPATVSIYRRMAETVRALASAVVRFELYDGPGRDKLLELYPDLRNREDREAARTALRTACARLEPTVTEAAAAPGRPSVVDLVWPDPVIRGIARALVDQTSAYLSDGDPLPALERRLLALGTPLDRRLRGDLRADLARLRTWLLSRLETSPNVTSCGLRGTVAAVVVPPPLAPSAEGGEAGVTADELRELARVADALYAALYRYVADVACGTLLPPPVDCTDPDVLLATVEIQDCTVLRICAADRQQVLPGGAAYGAWLSEVHQLRELAGRVCCGPVPRDVAVEKKDGVRLPFVPGWLGQGPDRSDLGRLLDLLAATEGA